MYSYLFVVICFAYVHNVMYLSHFDTYPVQHHHFRGCPESFDWMSTDVVKPLVGEEGGGGGGVVRATRENLNQKAFP